MAAEVTLKPKGLGGQAGHCMPEAPALLERTAGEEIKAREKPAGEGSGAEGKGRGQ